MLNDTPGLTALTAAGLLAQAACALPFSSSGDKADWQQTSPQQADGFGDRHGEWGLSTVSVRLAIFDQTHLPYWSTPLRDGWRDSGVISRHLDGDSLSAMPSPRLAMGEPAWYLQALGPIDAVWADWQPDPFALNRATGLFDPLAFTTATNPGIMVPTSTLDHHAVSPSFETVMVDPQR